MKIKFTAVLMLLMTIVSASVFTSCKDYDEDNYNELRSQYSSLKEYIDAKDAALKGQITSLEQQLAEINSCTCTPCGCTDDHIKQVIADYLTANPITPEEDDIYAIVNKFFKENAQDPSGEFNSYMTEIINQYMKEAMNGTGAGSEDSPIITLIKSYIEQAGKCISDDEIKALADAQIHAYMLEHPYPVVPEIPAVTPGLTEDDVKALIQQAIEGLSNCDCEEGVKKAYVDELVATTAATLATKAALEEAIEDLKDGLSIVAGAIMYVEENTNIRIDSLITVVNALDARIIAAQAAADAAKAVADNNTLAIDTIKTDLITLNTELGKVQDEAAQALALAKADSVRIDALKDAIDAINSCNCDPSKYYTKEEVDSINAQFATVKQLASAADSIRTLAYSYTDEQVKVVSDKLAEVEKTLTDKVENLEVSIAEIEKAYKAADEELQSQIDELKDALEPIKADIAKLQENVKKIENALAKLITSIQIQGTTNDLFGSFALPVGINSNVLIAYYGFSGNPVQFPTKQTGNYVFKDQALTAEEWKALGLTEDDVYNADADKLLISDADDNAGTIYVTVNPSSVDFTGTKFMLANSLGQESGIKLGELRPSNKLISFGYSRGAKGFYEASAHLDAKDVYSVTPHIEGGWRDAASDLLKKRNLESVKNIATKLYGQVSDILPANAVEADWTDEYGDHSVVSQYAVAATALRSPGFAFLKDLNVKKVPGLDQAEKLINSTTKELKKKVKLNMFNDLKDDLAGLQIKKIELKELTPELLAKFEISMDTTLVLSGLKYHLDFKDTIPVAIHTVADINAALKDVHATVPEILVNTDITTEDGSGVLVVPVVGKDRNGNDTIMGNATVELEKVKVDASASIENPTFSINGNVAGTAVVNCDTVVYVNIQKDVFFGTHRYDYATNQYVEDPNGDVRLMHIWITRDMKDAANDLWDLVKEQLGGVNDMLGDFQKVVDDANDLLGSTGKFEGQINEAIDNVKDKIFEYLDKANTKVCNLINSANDRLQPVMVINGEKTGAGFLSAVPVTVKDATIALHPTTWTGETIAPAFKKHIACVKAVKAGSTANDLSAVKAINAQSKLNEVIDGGLVTIDVNLQKGYSYTFAYSALDYNGQIVTKRFTLRY